MAYGSDEDFYGTVVHSEHLTPSLVRIVFGGEGLRGWRSDGYTDSYLVFWFPPPGASYAAPFSVDAIEAEHASEWWPAHRHYTVRAWDPERMELTVDFVVHGDHGVAGPWARRAQPGDQVVLSLPGGAYSPDPAADWHLMIGDESALPAIAAALEAVPAHSRAIALLVCDGPDHELTLTGPASLEVRWLHRTGTQSGASLLTDAVRELAFPPGRLHGFIHGEAGEVRDVRRHLLGDRRIPREHLSVSGYWRRTMTDEAWREIKRDWNADVEADVPSS